MVVFDAVLVLFEKVISHLLRNKLSNFRVTFNVLLSDLQETATEPR